MDANTYHLELMFILLNIFSCKNWFKKKKNAGRDLILRRKDKKQKIGCEFIRTNTSKHDDEDYEIGRIQTFISKFKDKKFKKLDDKIKKLTGQITQ